MDSNEKDESFTNGRPANDKHTASGSDAVKVAQIEAACSQHDLGAVRSLAVAEGGLLADELRRKAWPILLAVDHESAAITPLDSDSLPTHKDEGQVSLDVERAFVYYPTESDAQLSSRKASLQRLINAVLRRHPYLCYFQGFHDIVQVFLLVFGSSPPLRPSKQPAEVVEWAACVACVERLSLLRIRDFLLPTLDGLNAHMRLLPSILEAADRELYLHVRQAHRSYSLSGLLTLYAHEIQEYGVIARLFDFLLATDAVMSIYLFVAILLSRRDTVFEIDSTDTDMLLHILSKLPQPLNVEAILAHALHLYTQHPPQKLPNHAWRQISSASVLKTCICSLEGEMKTERQSRALSRVGWHTSSGKREAGSSVPFEEQSLSDGEACFHAQAAELERAAKLDKLWKQACQMWTRYRRPARNMVLVMTAVVLAYWMRPGTGQNNVMMRHFWRSVQGVWLGR